jgi:hypothetical protein
MAFVAEWPSGLGKGLQSPVHGFDSRLRLFDSSRLNGLSDAVGYLLVTRSDQRRNFLERTSSAAVKGNPAGICRGMVKIRRWVIGQRKKVVWSEPKLPPYVKINPDSPPGAGEGLQPGDMSMGAMAEEFLTADEGEEETPPLEDAPPV